MWVHAAVCVGGAYACTLHPQHTDTSPLQLPDFLGTQFTFIPTEVEGWMRIPLLSFPVSSALMLALQTRLCFNVLREQDSIPNFGFPYV